MVAGLPSAGIHVTDLNSVPIPVARYMTKAFGAAGGIHVRLSSFDKRIVDIQFYDSDGLDIDSTAERKIESIFFREDYRRAYLEEVGRITHAENIEKTYSEGFFKALRPEAIRALSSEFNLVMRVTGFSGHSEKLLAHEVRTRRSVGGRRAGRTASHRTLDWCAQLSGTQLHERQHARG